MPAYSYTADRNVKRSKTYLGQPRANRFARTRISKIFLGWAKFKLFSASPTDRPDYFVAEISESVKSTDRPKMVRLLGPDNPTDRLLLCERFRPMEYGRATRGMPGDQRLKSHG